MSYLSWATVFELVVVVSFWACLTHIAFGSLTVALTHGVIGALAAIMRGHCSE